MQPLESGVPWLERYTTDSDAPERTPLKSLPFTIGRIDTTDLQINSTRVSREHAEIVREGGDYLIRDLGSTNGTFVNGERIEESPLHDGDVVLIADCEFTFVANIEDARPRNMATQAMAPAERPPSVARITDPILAIRRVQEMVIHRGLMPQLRPILDMEQGAISGYWAQPADHCWKGNEIEPLARSQTVPRGALGRASTLYRLLAAEAFVNLGQGSLVIVDIAATEVEHDPSLSAHLQRLQSIVGASRLVVGLAANAVCDEPPVRTLAERLKSDGVRLAYLNFLGGRSQLQQMSDLPPDLLLLAANAASELNNPRQNRQLVSIVEGCQLLGCQPVVTGLRKREDEEACQKLGFQLVVTDRMNRSASTSSGAKLKHVDAHADCLA